MKEAKMNKRGLFVVIEGIDGTGKTTQAEILKARLESDGHSVESVDFPRYGDVSSKPVQMYLNGELGDLQSIGAEASSLLFAFDRKQAADQIRQWLESGRIVLSNRYVASNLGHQGGKIQDPQERRKFWDKSGISIKNHVTTLAGVIDSNYRGELYVTLTNLGRKIYKVKKGEKIAQLVIKPVLQAEIIEVEKIEENETRGERGFGSSGLV